MNISVILIDDPDDPKRDKSKCPAIMFALKRIERVIGRIKSLISSINTIKGIKIDGVPRGVKWVIISEKKLNHPKIIIPSHILKDRDRENLKCLEEVKI